MTKLVTVWLMMLFDRPGEKNMVHAGSAAVA